MKISELKRGMRGVNVSGKIEEISEVRRVNTRYGPARVADAKLTDDSGSIKLTLWNEQLDNVGVGYEVDIENGYITEFRGELQLNVGKFGKLSVKK